MIKNAIIETTVIDARGRVIKLKKPNVLAQYRLVEVLGESARNGVYTAMVLPLIYVVAIDDDEVMSSTSKLQIDALIQRLDDDGVNAVMSGVQEYFGNSDSQAEKEKIKN